jgi:hypothetical protein
VTAVTVHQRPPKHSDRTGCNENTAGLLAKFVGSMRMFYATIIGFEIRMAGLGSRSRETTIRSTSGGSRLGASCVGSR